MWPCLFAWVWFAGSLAYAEGGATSLDVVLDAANLPYSDRKGQPPGLDTEIAIELSKRLGQTLQVHWVDSLDEGLLTPVLRENAGVDIAIGIPIEERAVEERLRVGEHALYSIPYASTGYVLVTRKDFRDVNSFEDIGRATIGVELGSVGGHELWNQGYLLRQFGSQERIIDEVANGGLDCGLLWANAGWFIAQDELWKERLKIQRVKPDIADMRWNVAIALGRHNRELLPLLDSAIIQMKQEGVFKRIFAKYNIPYFEAFEEESR